jgi:uncharacterized protein
MKTLRALVAFVSLLHVFGTVACFGVDAAATPAGYWEGAISLPNRELEIRVDLVGDGSTPWKGTIDIPLQGLRGFALGEVKVDGATVAFMLPAIPGEPRFAGKLASDGKVMAGNFTQAGNTFPFQVERRVKPAPTIEDKTPAQGVPGTGIAGNWRGSIKTLPGVELRLALELQKNASGQVEGVLVSLDQGSARIPITGFSEKDGSVTFETPSVQGSFAGKMNADGSELAGSWSQMGNSTPLVLKRLPSKS